MSYARRYESLMERRPPSLIQGRNLAEEADAEIAALRAEVEQLKNESAELMADVLELRGEVGRLRNALAAIENWDPNWAQGVDENIDAIRDYARAALQQEAKQ